jgi:hypothetical protein
MTLLTTVNKKNACNVAFINVISKADASQVFINIVNVSMTFKIYVEVNRT